MEESFVKVGKVSAFPDGRGKRVRVGDDEIALWRVRGKFYAIDNVCAHQHFALLHEGILQDLTVACPMHGWTYSLETGRAVVGSGRVRTFAVRVVGEDVWVSCDQTSDVRRQT